VSLALAKEIRRVREKVGRRARPYIPDDPAALFEMVIGTPDEWQAQALRSPRKRQLYLCSRQSGKSSVAAIKALQVALHRDGAVVLLVSPSLPQSQEIFRKCLVAYHHLGRPKGVARESALRLELGNGSRIISLPGSENTNVAYSADLVVIDEAARTPGVLFESMMPTVAVTGGGVVALSSPKGARGWFHRLWTQPDVDEVWERFQVTADECPRITQEMLDEALFDGGPRHVEQEYYCSFLADTDSFFNPEDLSRSLADEGELWFPERNAS
jgi:hypothetical protein